MKTTCVAAALCLIIGLVSASFAQGSGGRRYDPKTVETVSGEVIKVEHVQGKAWAPPKGGRGGAYGIHLILKSDKEEIAVHLGPSWYLDKHGLTFAEGDRLEVRGSRITFDGKPAIIAAEVKKGDQSLKLRDADGAPVWRGRGRRGA